MRILLVIIYLGTCFSCNSDPASISSAEQERKLKNYNELWIRYYLAFEKHLYVDLEGLYNLDSRTRKILQKQDIPAQKVSEVKKWHHKLKSYISFVLVANPVDSNGIIKTKITALLLQQLRRESPSQIDLSQPNEGFYQLARKGKINTETVSDRKIQFFFKDFLAENLAITEESIKKSSLLFPFVEMDINFLCQNHRHVECNKLNLSSVEAHVSIENFTDLNAVTAKVNNTIIRLNRVITTLNIINSNSANPLDLNEINFKNPKVIEAYKNYELILLESADSGILPLFFTEIFKERSGKVHLTDWKSLASKNNLLTSVTTQTVEKCITETRTKIVSRWTEIKKLSESAQSVSHKEIYKWIISNEIVVSRLILQQPAHSVTVSFLMKKYEDKIYNSNSIKIIEKVLTVVGIGTLGLLVGSFMPFLSVGSLLSKAIIISTAANFGWIGLGISKAVTTHRHSLTLERSLLSGTSERISENLEVLRNFEKARLQAILSGGIGLSLSAASFNYILRSVHNGTKPFLTDFITKLFPEEKETFISVSEGLHL